MFLRVWQAAALSTERSEAAYLLRVWSRAAIGTAPHPFDRLAQPYSTSATLGSVS
jgi:hypothetical protein